MSVIHTQGKPTVDVRLIAFPAVCSLFLLALFLRLWYFQVVLSASLTELASHSQRRNPSVLAPRGRIFDREGNLIAGVKPELVVTAIPREIHDHPEVLAKVAALLGAPEKKLRSKLLRALSPLLPVPIYVGAPVEVGAKILEERDDLPGIDVETEPMRYYANSTDFTHILGNVWVPSQGDVDRLTKEEVKPAEYVGKGGIEWFYEKLLMGRPGTQVIETDAKHRPVRVLGGDSAVPGSQLTLSVDETLQKIAQTELVYPKNYSDHSLAGLPRKGAVVALDPTTGEILCMYSSPSYDLKLFEGGIKQDDLDALTHDLDKPQFNRATSGTYAPGSTFKIVTSLAMQESGILDTSERVFCDGGFHVGKATVRCEGHHGSISYAEAFAKSCNTYFCTMGTKVGIDALAKAAHDMGLGTAVDIDLRADGKTGVVPDPAYKEKIKQGRWYTGDTANTAIGQGFVLASPLQMADVAAMVANRGTIYRPHLVHSMRTSGEREAELVKPEVLHKIDMPQSFWDILTSAMQGVLEKGGTAYKWRIPGLDWAGKTGSAEFRKKSKTDSWFVGFAPLNNPRIAIAVVVEGGGQGADPYGAAEISSHIIQAYLFPKAAVQSAKTPSNSASDAAALAASSGRPAAR